MKNPTLQDQTLGKSPLPGYRSPEATFRILSLPFDRSGEKSLVQVRRNGCSRAQQRLAGPSGAPSWVVQHPGRLKRPIEGGPHKGQKAVRSLSSQRARRTKKAAPHNTKRWSTMESPPGGQWK